MGALAGAVPSNVIFPLIVAAVAGSMAVAALPPEGLGCSWPCGAGAGAPPPHAAAASVNIRGKPSSVLEFIETLLNEEDDITYRTTLYEYHTEAGCVLVPLRGFEPRVPWLRN